MAFLRSYRPPRSTPPVIVGWLVGAGPGPQADVGGVEFRRVLRLLRAERAGQDDQGQDCKGSFHRWTPTTFGATKFLGEYGEYELDTAKVHLDCGADRRR